MPVSPGGVLVHLAQALRISTDVLLGAKPTKEGTSPKTARLLKRLQKVEALPACRWWTRRGAAVGRF